jgi:hypothetical protein
MMILGIALANPAGDKSIGDPKVPMAGNKFPGPAS